MVDRLDEGLDFPLITGGDYEELHGAVAKALFRAHVEGQLKVRLGMIAEGEVYVFMIFCTACFYGRRA